jgi:hypothetical protein
MIDNSDMIEYEINEDNGEYEAKKDEGNVKDNSKKSSSKNKYEIGIEGNKEELNFKIHSNVISNRSNQKSEKSEKTISSKEVVAPLITQKEKELLKLLTKTSADNLIPTILNTNIITTNDSLNNKSNFVSNKISTASVINQLVTNAAKHHKKQSSTINNNSSNTNNIKKSNNNSVNTSLSFGERLYRKAVALKDVKEKKTKELKNILNKEEKKECSFQPKMNEDSFMMSFRVS